MTMWIEMKNHFQARSLEWWDAGVLFSWGFYTSLHPGMMKTIPTFRAMLDMFPENVWGLATLLVGGIRLVALFINGQWGVTPGIRIVTSFASVFVWFWVCIGLYKSGIANPGLIIYPAFMLAGIISVFRASSDAYEAAALRHLKKLSETQNVLSFKRG